MSPDAFLMDRIVQPIVDRLPKDCSCFDVARWGNHVYLLAYFFKQVARDIGLIAPAGPAWFGPVLLLCCGAYAYGTALDIDKAETAARASPGMCNTFRIDPKYVVLTWWFVFLVVGEIFIILSSAWDVNDLYRLGYDGGLVCVVMVRAQPRHPNARRKNWLPSLPGQVMAPQGSAA